jgi:hypothetical protein
MRRSIALVAAALAATAFVSYGFLVADWLRHTRGFATRPSPAAAMRGDDADVAFSEAALVHMTSPSYSGQ